MLGLVLVPVVLAKLWSVMPKLFVWPPWRSVAQMLERLSLVLVVGGIVFELTTGILDIDYASGINFYSGHFYGAWAFMAGFVLPCMRQGGGHGPGAQVEELACRAQDRPRPHRSRGTGQRPRRPAAGCAYYLPQGSPSVPSGCSTRKVG